MSPQSTGAAAPKADVRVEMAEGDCMPELVALGDEGPVVQIEYAGGPVWLVGDPDLARAACTDPRLSKEARFAPPWFRDPSGLVGSGETAIPSLITSDGARHARIRRLHRDLFAATAIAEWTGRIGAATSELLDRAVAKGRRIDVVPDLAYALPLQIFCRFLGLPRHLDATLRDASEDITFGGDPEVRGRGVGRLFGTVAHCIQEPDQLSPGFITSLLELATGDEPQITIPEVATWSAGIVLPGHESTASLIASSIHRAITLPRHDRPRSGPEIEAFIEETLRVHPPFLTPTFRFATKEMELGGIRIPEGAPVLINIPAVNHRSASHQSFGHGAHYCLGAPLSRLETRIALSEFLRRFPDARAAEDVPARWQSDIAVRRLATLPVDV